MPPRDVDRRRGCCGPGVGCVPHCCQPAHRDDGVDYATVPLGCCCKPARLGFDGPDQPLQADENAEEGLARCGVAAVQPVCCWRCRLRLGQHLHIHIHLSNSTAGDHYLQTPRLPFWAIIQLLKLLFTSLPKHFSLVANGPQNSLLTSSRRVEDSRRLPKRSLSVNCEVRMCDTQITQTSAL